MLLLKVICIFFAILFTYSNTLRFISKQPVVAMNMIIMSIAYTGLILLFFLL